MPAIPASWKKKAFPSSEAETGRGVTMGVKTFVSTGYW